MKVQDLRFITDERIFSELRDTDLSQGKWLAEDPSLARIQQWIALRTPPSAAFPGRFTP